MPQLTAEFLAAILAGRGLVNTAQHKQIETAATAERQSGTRRRRNARGKEEPAATQAYRLVIGLNLGNQANGGAPLDENAIGQAIAADAALPFLKIDSLKLDANLIEESVSRPFARKHLMIPITMREGVLQVAVANPYDVEGIDTYRRLSGRQLDLVVASEPDVSRVINEFYGLRASVTKAEKNLTQGIDLGNLEQYIKMKSASEIEASDQHIVNAVEYLLTHAYDSRASDIHLEPKREDALIRFRIDGVLHEIQRLPRLVHAAVVSRIKTLARLDIAEKRRPQDGRIKTDRNGREIELRVSTLPVAFGEKIVMRIFDPEVLMGDLGGLGFYPEELALFQEFIARPHGIILLTGPTGSGKTTTLYSALRALATADFNITTIEDPIEMIDDAFNQTAVQPKIGITFGSALRTVLRQDPDIIMVGEIRDTETAENAVAAALTGHLVFSTLHTNDAATSITRLKDLEIAPFLISSCLIGAMAQRLVRLICTHCKASRPLSRDEMATLALSAPAGKRIVVKEGEGCIQCRGTGYRGRTGIFEILKIDSEIAQMIDRGADFIEVKNHAIGHGMRTLRSAALRKLAEGITSFEEVVRVTGI